MNNVTLVGNLVGEPELKFQSDTSVVNMSLAVNESYKDAQGNWKDRDPTYIDLVVWGNNGAENVAESLEKGGRVIVIGKLKLNKWQDKEGNPRSKHEMVVSEIGPSLKWATADVTRTSTGNNSGGNKYTTPECDF